MASNACGAPQSILLVGDESPSPSFAHIVDMRLRVSAKHFLFTPEDLRFDFSPVLVGVDSRLSVRSQIAAHIFPGNQQFPHFIAGLFVLWLKCVFLFLQNFIFGVQIRNFGDFLYAQGIKRFLRRFMERDLLLMLRGKFGRPV